MNFMSSPKKRISNPDLDADFAHYVSTNPFGLPLTGELHEISQFFTFSSRSCFEFAWTEGLKTSWARLNRYHNELANYKMQRAFSRSSVKSSWNDPPAAIDDSVLRSAALDLNKAVAPTEDWRVDQLIDLALRHETYWRDKAGDGKNSFKQDSPGYNEALCDFYYAMINITWDRAWDYAFDRAKKNFEQRQRQGFDLPVKNIIAQSIDVERNVLGEKSKALAEKIILMQKNASIRNANKNKK